MAIPPEGPRSSANLFDQVRKSTERVVATATHVSWNIDRLLDLTGTFDPKTITDSYAYEGDFYFMAPGEPRLDYVITLNALNFGSGLSIEWKEQRQYPGSSFKSTAAGLKRLAEDGVPLNPQFAASVDEALIAQILGVDPDFRLVSMFRRSLNELGQFVSIKYGSYTSMINSLDPETRAALLVELLSTNLETYHDVSRYKRSDVFFLKRAQILASDLYLAFGGSEFGEIGDIDELTMFADNLLPHYFRVEGVLTYSDDLLARISKGEEIPSGSPEEVEIRAFAVQCIERIKQVLIAKNPQITAAQIDNYLWQVSQDSKYKSLPRHRTVTYFY